MFTFTAAMSAWRLIPLSHSLSYLYAHMYLNGCPPMIRGIFWCISFATRRKMGSLRPSSMYDPTYFPKSSGVFVWNQ